MLISFSPFIIDRYFSFERQVCAAIILIGTIISTAPASADIKNAEEVTCLALNIYFEARDQPFEGKIAVGHVVMNRVANPRFPKSVCEVIRQGGEDDLHRCQFSWWCDGHSDQPRNTRAWKESIHIAKKIFDGFSDDPTDGALWYHADYVHPYWRKTMKPTLRIGAHVFYLRGKSSEKMTGTYDR